MSEATAPHLRDVCNVDGGVRPLCSHPAGEPVHNVYDVMVIVPAQHFAELLRPLQDRITSLHLAPRCGLPAALDAT